MILKKYEKCEKILLDTTNYKLTQNHLLAVHHKVVLVADIYVVPTGVVVLGVKEA
jgi:hypothetical protein